MNTPIPDESARQDSPRALLKTLQERFPVFRDFSPLAIGIDKQLLVRLPELDRRALRTALRMHTNSLRYLKTIEKATHRIDLDGNSADEITETHRGHAVEVLRERFRKDAERRRMQREAEATARKRSEKLSQLLDKFGKER